MGELNRGHGSCVPDLSPHWLVRVGAGPMPRRTVSYTLRSLSMIVQTS